MQKDKGRPHRHICTPCPLQFGELWLYVILPRWRRQHHSLKHKHTQRVGIITESCSVTTLKREAAHRLLCQKRTAHISTALVVSLLKRNWLCNTGHSSFVCCWFHYLAGELPLNSFQNRYARSKRPVNTNNWIRSSL